MHKIYKNKGAFDIIGQLPQIIYSSLISMLFSMILEFLALTEGIILKLKQIVIRKEFSKKIKSLNNRIKIKFLLYFIISTIFLMLFWYYNASRKSYCFNSAMSWSNKTFSRFCPKMDGRHFISKTNYFQIFKNNLFLFN